ncbi:MULTISPECIES: hypothetical protein [unclassified Bradyrhizobium]|uniref:hypothetical protein n=1 Tax=unclassified Bradyrhizobium TaxID=2631580 RepID=UPI00247AFAC9|nr:MULTISPECIES: hypothetical protein [unclassified Bradyrhizobium]WGR73079.1 hypothetical protein MTX24_09705 [Bradyrhizobium sp. ISRA426]WGR77917.1 hypothetical protein MTX21_34670 [Bradyrhizobium sp. ISRA430]WGR88319.1 hypothetical protein MTX25_09710 [Bradyrhizobium sp. ISRA432]
MRILKKIGNRILWQLPPSETITGYENPELVDLIVQKTKRLLDQPIAPWPEMANFRSVLDFGGSCGIHYFRAKSTSPEVRWAVVETPAMAERAKQFESDGLKFFTSIAGAQNWLGEPDAVFSEGALQFTQDPETHLADLCGLGASSMIWQRVSLSRNGRQVSRQSSLLSENGPGFIVSRKRVEYQIIRIPESVFLQPIGTTTCCPRKVRKTIVLARLSYFDESAR